MKNSYGLKFTPIAEDDLDRIYRYISEHLVAPKAANDLMDNIESSIIRLKEFPYLGSLVKDYILRSRGYRKFIVKNYIAFYLVDETEKLILIIRVLNDAQKYESIL